MIWGTKLLPHNLHILSKAKKNDLLAADDNCVEKNCFKTAILTTKGKFRMIKMKFEVEL